MLVSKVCLALETTPICNLGSERLYENFINECVSIGVNKNEFSVLMYYNMRLLKMITLFGELKIKAGLLDII